MPADGAADKGRAAIGSASCTARALRSDGPDARRPQPPAEAHAAGIATLLFLVFIVLFVISLLFGTMRRPPMR